MRSHLLVGKVMHHRLTPVDYRFEHDVFYLALDLDELAEVDRNLRLLAYNRANVFALLDGDHFDGGDLRASAHEAATLANLPGDARVTMVAYPRAAGYLFNPVTFYLVRSQGRLVRVVAEVHNTHRERFVYPLEGEYDATGAWTATAEKQFYVSPFIAPEGSYMFTIRDTARQLEIRIDERDATGETVLLTGLRLQRRRLRDRTLAAAGIRIPVVGLKTIALIHFHAVRLWMRRLPFYSHGAAA